MKNFLLILSTGFAMFSMFFGSGNLVFPLEVGKESGGYPFFAGFGIFLTGVVVPFLGVLGLLLFKGDNKEFFGKLGKPAVFWLSFISLSLMGPFGVLARCITVAQGSFRLMFPEVSLIAFSLGMCAFIFLLTMKKNKIVPALGAILTPVLLLTLVLLGYFGLTHEVNPAAAGAISSSVEAMQNGIFKGYMTMDLLAAFFFSSFVIKHLEEDVKVRNENSCFLNIFLKSATLGAGLLAAIYFVLVFLGNKFAYALEGVAPEEMLGTIANQVLGSYSGPVVCAAVILACLTTAVVLATLFAEFIKKEVSVNKLSDGMAMLVTLAIAFGVSTLEFSGIAGFLGPILETIYPALIVLTLINILNKCWGTQLGRWPVFAALATKLFII